MNTAMTIIISVILGLLLLFTVLGLVYAGVRRKLEKIVADRFGRDEMLGATTRANFFGIASKGGAQVRGNGALVLTRDNLCFIRAVPRKAYEIPIRSIRRVSMPTFFNGKSALVPLLCVHYDAGYGEDAMAWALKDAKQWKASIEKMID